MCRRIFPLFLFILFSIISVSRAQTSKIFFVDDEAYCGTVQSVRLDGTVLRTVSSDLERPCGLAIDDQSNPQKIYFCIRSEQRIVRANLDGSSQEDVITDVPGIRDIELDLANRKIYWVRDTWDDDAVQRADLDGLNANIEDLYTSTSVGYGFYGIGLDHARQRVYWTQAYNGCSDKIRRMNFDKTGFTNVVIYPQSTLLNPWDIDVAGDKIYWTDCGLSEDVILYADLDGSNIDTLIKEVDCQFFTIDEQTSKVYWCEDNKIGRANLDGSGRETVVDGLGMFLMGIGIAHNVPATSIEKNEPVANTIDLLDNYPNPFNAVTTIRYHIAYSQMLGTNTVGTQNFASPPFASLPFVTITIHDMMGKHIATLVSDRKPYGYHTVQWNAAAFASGMYYYKLTVSTSSASDFSVTKRMLLMK